MPIIYGPDSDNRQLIKTSEDEAVDLQTGAKYKLERVDERTSMVSGVLIGLLLALLLWFSSRSESSVPQQQPTPTPSISQNFGSDLSNNE